jgi:hypothetical protein
MPDRREQHAQAGTEQGMIIDDQDFQAGPRFSVRPRILPLGARGAAR